MYDGQFLVTDLSAHQKPAIFSESARCCSTSYFVSQLLKTAFTMFHELCGSASGFVAEAVELYR